MKRLCRHSRAIAPAEHAGGQVGHRSAPVFKPIKLVDFIRDAKADNASQLIARLSRLLHIAFGYSLSP
jgi:hypothetical protein